MEKDTTHGQTVHLLTNHLVTPLGNSYDGDYLQGQRSGFGLYTWEDGSHYKGNWLDGQRHGEGHYLDLDGKQYAEVWDHNKRLERVEISN